LRRPLTIGLRRDEFYVIRFAEGIGFFQKSFPLVHIVETAAAATAGVVFAAARRETTRDWKELLQQPKGVERRNAVRAATRSLASTFTTSRRAGAVVIQGLREPGLAGESNF